MAHRPGHKRGCRCVGCSPRTRAKGMRALKRAAKKPRRKNPRSKWNAGYYWLTFVDGGPRRRVFFTKTRVALIARMMQFDGRQLQMVDWDEDQSHGEGMRPRRFGPAAIDNPTGGEIDLPLSSWAFVFKEFGVAYKRLSQAQRILILKDVAAIVNDEQRTAEDAVKVLRTRIGGPKNLQAYAETLEAGARHRTNPTYHACEYGRAHRTAEGPHAGSGKCTKKAVVQFAKGTWRNYFCMEHAMIVARDAPREWQLKRMQDANWSREFEMLEEIRKTALSSGHLRTNPIIRGKHYPPALFSRRFARYEEVEKIDEKELRRRQKILARARGDAFTWEELNLLPYDEVEKLHHAGKLSETTWDEYQEEMRGSTALEPHPLKSNPVTYEEEDWPEGTVPCSACGKPVFRWADPCMDCVRSRAKVATSGRGRCTCPKKLQRPSEVHKMGSRRWITCGRCLGTIKQLNPSDLDLGDTSMSAMQSDQRYMLVVKKSATKYELHTKMHSHRGGKFIREGEYGSLHAARRQAEKMVGRKLEWLLLASGDMLAVY